MDIIRRLATSQARGERQLSLVNELLSFRELDFFYIPVPGRPGTASIVYGRTRLPISSYRNLRKRLIGVGFVFSTNWDDRTILMSFPEANI